MSNHKREPNIQNIPVRTKEAKEIQEAFSKPNKEIVVATSELGTGELRVMAKLWEAIYGRRHK